MEAPEIGSKPDSVPEISPSTNAWQCKTCGEWIDQQFASCWKCSGNPDGASASNTTAVSSAVDPVEAGRRISTAFKFVMCALLLLAAVVLYRFLYSPGDKNDVHAAIQWRTSGIQCVKDGKIDEAIADFSRAIEYDPDDASAYTWRGSAHLKKKEFDQTIEDATRAILLSSSDYVALEERATANLELDKVDDAFADIKELIRIHPSSKFAYSLRCRIYFRKGDLRSALTDADTDLSRNQESSLAHEMRGLIYSEMDRFDSAIDELTMALDLRKKAAKGMSDTMLANRALEYYWKGDLTHALEDVTESARLNPSSIIARMVRGRIRQSMGEVDMALNDFQQAKQIEPHTSHERRNRTFALALCGETDMAIREFLKWRDAYPWDRWIEYTLAQIYCFQAERRAGGVDSAKSRQADLDSAEACLEAAVKKGFRSLIRLMNDPDLRALRSRADFQALITNPIFKQDNP